MSDHPRDLIFLEIEAERHRQDKKWGEQNHPNGTGSLYAGAANAARRFCEFRFAEDNGTWADIFSEEVYEALAEDDVAGLRRELIQAAAVAVSWIEALERQVGA